ncbi:MAG TPA: acyl carrier protein [Flavitalea sp.]|nr:acyl carrier protein [Flavitalea sp.]
MARGDILSQVTKILMDILDVEDLTITEKTYAADVNDWDSLNHIQLIVAIEKHFKIRFTSREIQSWSNVGEMIDSIERKKIDN